MAQIQIAELVVTGGKAALARDARLVRKARQLSARQDMQYALLKLQRHNAKLEQELRSWRAWWQHPDGDSTNATLKVPTRYAKRANVQIASLVCHAMDCDIAGKDIHYARNASKDPVKLNLHRAAGAAKHDKLHSDPWFHGHKAIDPWAVAAHHPSASCAARPSATEQFPAPPAPPPQVPISPAQERPNMDSHIEVHAPPSQEDICMENVPNTKSLIGSPFDPIREEIEQVRGDLSELITNSVPEAVAGDVRKIIALILQTADENPDMEQAAALRVPCAALSEAISADITGHKDHITTFLIDHCGRIIDSRDELIVKYRKVLKEIDDQCQPSSFTSPSACGKH